VSAPKAVAVLGSPRGRKYVSITGDETVELVTAWSGGEMVRRNGDWGGREVRRGVAASELGGSFRQRTTQRGVEA
jgi:hypothetical protein